MFRLFQVLSELEAALKAGDGDSDSKAAAIHKATNTFYAIIPHSFGMRKVTGNFDIMSDKIARISQLRTTPHAPCAMLYFVPVLVGC